MSKNTITMIYGNDIIKNTKELLKSYQIENKIPDKSSSIGLKPNLVIAAKPESGATTHPEIIIGTIEYLKDHGFHNISILEGAWVGDSTERGFQVNGYYGIAEKYNVTLVDTKKDKYNVHTKNGITMEISQKVEALDYLINLPVLKGHCQTYMTCAMKNLKGVLSDRSKRMFHTLGLDNPIAVLNTIIKPNLNIVDAICGDLDFEEGGNPIPMERMYLCEDAVLTDSFSASLMGFDTSDIKYIPIGAKLGAGNMNYTNDFTLIELNHPTQSEIAQPSLYTKRLAKYIEPSSACSCCYANLIHALKRMEDTNTLKRLNGKPSIKIGQDYKNKEMEIGIGNCCKRAKNNAPGCPPRADVIFSLLSKLK